MKNEDNLIQPAPIGDKKARNVIVRMFIGLALYCLNRNTRLYNLFKDAIYLDNVVGALILYSLFGIALRSAIGMFSFFPLLAFGAPLALNILIYNIPVVIAGIKSKMPKE